MLLKRNIPAVLVHTDQGFLLIYNIKQKIWNALLSDDRYGSYAIAKANHTENYIAIGNTKGMFLKEWHSLHKL